MGIQRSSNPCMDCPLVESLAADAADSIERVFDYMEICSCAGDPIYERFLELFFDQFEDTHPSGSPQPSEEDRTVTKRLAECGKMMDIRMLDHIIVAGESGQMMSFKQDGLMPQLERDNGWER